MQFLGQNYRREVGILLGIISFFVLKYVWFFNRSGSINIDKFNTWLDKKFNQSPFPFLIVYPQGHRMYDKIQVRKQKIKRGMIKYAYTRNIPVQIVISFGNEKVLDQKKLKINYGQQVKYKIGKVIDPKDYKDANQFVDASVNQFISYFDQTLGDCQKNVKTQNVTQQMLNQIQFKTQKIKKN